MGLTERCFGFDLNAIHRRRSNIYDQSSKHEFSPMSRYYDLKYGELQGRLAALDDISDLCGVVDEDDNGQVILMGDSEWDQSIVAANFTDLLEKYDIRFRQQLLGLPHVYPLALEISIMDRIKGRAQRKRQEYLFEVANNEAYVDELTLRLQEVGLGPRLEEMRAKASRETSADPNEALAEIYRRNAARSHRAFRTIFEKIRVLGSRSRNH